MRRVTNMIESCRMYEYVTSPEPAAVITQTLMSEPRHIRMDAHVSCHIWVSHVPCHTYEWVVLYQPTATITRTHDWATSYPNEWVMSPKNASWRMSYDWQSGGVRWMKEWWHTTMNERVVAYDPAAVLTRTHMTEPRHIRINESCHVWIRRDFCHMNESCRTTLLLS